MKTVRFWVYWNNSPVKITLKHKSVVSFGKYEDTDEGYSATEYSYEFDDRGNVVWCSSELSSDCDGPFSQSKIYLCDRDNLSAGKNNYPTWHQIEESKFDAYAAAMGY